jgi:NAD(P)H-hydrate epimerase
MKITTAEEMRQIDRRTSDEFGVPSLTLMDNAGLHVAVFVTRQYPEANRIVVVCGKGNNGGDGFVAARYLQEWGKQVTVILLGDAAEVKGDAAVMLGKLAASPTSIRSPEELKQRWRTLDEAEVVIDAVLGTGFKPPVSGVYEAVVRLMNSMANPKVAVDIPSGADADAFAPQETLKCRADAVFTFTAPRPAHIFGNLTRGPTAVESIGSPSEAIVSELNLDAIVQEDIWPYVAFRDPESNKGSFGHVLVIGGSVGKSGAAAMAGMGALRAGAGLVTIGTPRSVLPQVAGFAPELMTEPLAETDTGTISASQYARMDLIVDGKTVLALGPGITRNFETVEFIRAVVAKYTLPLVIDADGLNAFEGCADKLNGSKRPLVLTPHPGEMARLTGLSVKQVQQDRIDTARRFAREHKCIVVLKGHRTLVAEPGGHVWVNTTGNPGMATGGTGDVLTGMVAGMIAQHPTEVAMATTAAVYLHGLAGNVARESVGEHSLIATDLLRFLPEAFLRTRNHGPYQTIYP